jgi:hypothetical protein
MREHAWLLPLIVVVVIARPSRTWGRTNAVSQVLSQISLVCEFNSGSATVYPARE